MKRILTLLTVIFCLSSCEKEQKHWLSKTWYGEYGTQVQNKVYDDTKAFSLRKYPGDVEIKYVSEVVSGKRILKWREGNEERTVVINALLLE